MIVKRYEFQDAPLELIDRLAGDFFFSSTAFAGLWKTSGGKPVYWVVEHEGKITAVFPGVEFGSGLLRRFQSMPNGCYGKILYSEQLQNSCEVINTALASRIINEGYTKAFLTDFYSTINPVLGYDVRQFETQVVDISSPDWQPPDSKLRQQIHKAEKEGLNIVRFNASLHLKRFMNLVKLHEQRRDARSRYTLPFFEALAEVSRKDVRVKWLWCEFDDRSAASSIFVREGNVILHWQMYYDEAMSHLQATKLIPFRVARESTGSGIKFLNLGASPPEAEGAEQYKSKWGGEVVRYNCYIHKNLLGRLW